MTFDIINFSITIIISTIISIITSTIISTITSVVTVGFLFGLFGPMLNKYVVFVCESIFKYNIAEEHNYKKNQKSKEKRLNDEDDMIRTNIE